MARLKRETVTTTTLHLNDDELAAIAVCLIGGPDWEKSGELGDVVEDIWNLLEGEGVEDLAEYDKFYGDFYPL